MHQGFPVRARVVRDGILKGVNDAALLRVNHGCRGDGDALHRMCRQSLTHDRRDFADDTCAAVLPCLGGDGAVREEYALRSCHAVFDGGASDVDADNHGFPLRSIPSIPRAP